jgi:UDPglucose 6-dehydrogenase
LINKEHFRFIGIKTVSVIGLGKLGAPFCACVASRGFQIIGVDNDPEKVLRINNGGAPVQEPGLAQLLKRHAHRISATSDIFRAVLLSDATFIIVPTPSKKTGDFSLRHIIKVCNEIGRAIAEKKYHLIVVTSTVSPGSMDKIIKPCLEKISGKRCGVDFGLCYNPEFIALGRVIKDFLNPDFVLIGESDKFSGCALEKFYRRVCNNNPPVEHMNFINAELTKIAINTFITTKITYANMLARVCERLPGADVDIVTAAMGRDTRIGGKYLKGAIAYGGPCFPRDNIAFLFLTRKLKTKAELVESTSRMNRRCILHLSSIVVKELSCGGSVGILGLSYKPNTCVIDESPGIRLASHLLKMGINVIVHDPLAIENARSVLSGPVIFAVTIHEVFKKANVIAIMTPWEKYLKITGKDLPKFKKCTIIDCWRILDRKNMPENIKLISLGRGIETCRK